MTDDVAKPGEASLLDDPATADLTAKVAEAWSEFARALGQALATLSPGVNLDVTVDPAASGMGDGVYQVSAGADDGGQLHAFAVGNTMLTEENRLSRTAVGHLVALGWSPPAPAEERYHLVQPVAEANRVAAILGRTLRDVYGAPHPAFLRYAVDGGDPTAVPTLGPARPLHTDNAEPKLPPTVDLSVLSLPEKVATVLAAILKTTPENLPVDNDGDIAIRSGSAMVFVRVREEPPLIDVFSPVLTDVDVSQKLFAKLSELTSRIPIGRLYCASGTVWASVPVLGRDFQASHLMLAVQVMTGLADELDDRLHGEFGGKRFFVEADRAAPDDDEGHTGMYL